MFKCCFLVLLSVFSGVLLIDCFTKCATAKNARIRVLHEGRFSEVRDSAAAVYMVKTDTVISLEPDTAAMSALIECEGNSQALIRELNALQGQKVKITPKIQYTYIPAVTANGDTVMKRAAVLRITAGVDSLTFRISQYKRLNLSLLKVRDSLQARCDSLKESSKESKDVFTPMLRELGVALVLILFALAFLWCFYDTIKKRREME